MLLCRYDVMSLCCFLPCRPVAYHLFQPTPDPSPRRGIKPVACRLRRLSYTFTTLIRSEKTPAAVTSAPAPYPLITMGSSLYLLVVRRMILLLPSRLKEGCSGPIVSNSTFAFPWSRLAKNLHFLFSFDKLFTSSLQISPSYSLTFSKKWFRSPSKHSSGRNRYYHNIFFFDVIACFTAR